MRIKLLYIFFLLLPSNFLDGALKREFGHGNYFSSSSRTVTRTKFNSRRETKSLSRPARTLLSYLGYSSANYKFSTKENKRFNFYAQTISKSDNSFKGLLQTVVALRYMDTLFRIALFKQTKNESFLKIGSNEINKIGDKIISILSQKNELFKNYAPIFKNLSETEIKKGAALWKKCFNMSLYLNNMNKEQFDKCADIFRLNSVVFGGILKAFGKLKKGSSVNKVKKTNKKIDFNAAEKTRKGIEAEKINKNYTKEEVRNLNEIIEEDFGEAAHVPDFYGGAKDYPVFELKEAPGKKYVYFDEETGMCHLFRESKDFEYLDSFNPRRQRYELFICGDEIQIHKPFEPILVKPDVELGLIPNNKIKLTNLTSPEGYKVYFLLDKQVLCHRNKRGIEVFSPKGKHKGLILLDEEFYHGEKLINTTSYISSSERIPGKKISGTKYLKIIE